MNPVDDTKINNEIKELEKGLKGIHDAKARRDAAPTPTQRFGMK